MGHTEHVFGRFDVHPLQNFLPNNKENSIAETNNRYCINDDRNAPLLLAAGAQSLTLVAGHLKRNGGLRRRCFKWQGD